MKSKNILVLSYEYPLPWSGLADEIYEQVTHTQQASKNKYKVTVISGCPGDPILNPELNIKHIKVPRSRRFISLFFTASLFAYFQYLLLKIQGKVDMVHGHNHITFWFNLHKLLFGFIDKTPYLLTLHSTASGRKRGLESESVDFWSNYLEWPLHNLSDTVGSRVANKITCTTEEIKNDLVEVKNIPSDKITVIYDGVDTEMFNPEAPTMRMSRHLEKKKIILFYGTLSERNRIKVLIEAFDLLKEKDKYLILIGEGEDKYVESLRTLLRSKDLIQNSLIITDYNYSQLPPYFSASDIFVYNSLYEGSTHPVAQALASGVPCIVSGFEGYANTKINGIQLVDKEITSQDLSSKISKSLHNKKTLVDVTLVKRFLSWNSIAESYNKLYSTLLK